jgi:hypothetical protein
MIINLNNNTIMDNLFDKIARIWAIIGAILLIGTAITQIVIGIINGNAMAILAFVVLGYLAFELVCKAIEEEKEEKNK